MGGVQGRYGDWERELGFGDGSEMGVGDGPGKVHDPEDGVWTPDVTVEVLE